MKILVLFDIARRAAPEETFSPQDLKEREDKPTEADVLSCLERLGHQVETLAVFDNVLAIVEKLKAANVEAELLKLEGAGHGFKGKDAETAEKAMIAFFEKHLKKK